MPASEPESTSTPRRHRDGERIVRALFGLLVCAAVLTTIAGFEALNALTALDIAYRQQAGDVSTHAFTSLASLRFFAVIVLATRFVPAPAFCVWYHRAHVLFGVGTLIASALMLRSIVRSIHRAPAQLHNAHKGPAGLMCTTSHDS